MQVSAHAPTASSVHALQNALRSTEIRTTLLRIAGRRLGNPADAEDCVQEACVVAFLHVDQLREPEHVRAWLKTIVVNASRMRVRAEHGQRQVRAVPVDVRELRELKDPSLGVDDRLHAHRLLDDIRERVHRHDVRDRQVVDALLDDGVDYAELARRCAMTTSAFKTRVSRIRKRLKRAGLERAA